MRETGTPREPSGAPPLIVELACVLGALAAGIVSAWLLAWIPQLLSEIFG